MVHGEAWIAMDGSVGGRQAAGAAAGRFMICHERLILDPSSQGRPSQRLRPSWAMLVNLGAVSRPSGAPAKSVPGCRSKMD
jgi:hypothetical protein